jgi:metal-dependent amidase/aminoacylase/carboxypeptidase family protein
MHACGHDVHAAALVALSRAARAHGDDLPATLVAVSSRPRRSTRRAPTGSSPRAGLPDGIGAIVGVHLHPDLRWESLGIAPGAVNAACDNVRIGFHGCQTHAAYPHLNRDPSSRSRASSSRSTG